MGIRVLQSTLEFLGERCASPRSGDYSLVEVGGVSSRAMTRLSEFLNVCERDIYRLAGGTEHSYRRRSANPTWTIEGRIADALARMARVAQLASSVLGDDRRARAWLGDSIPFLDGRSPLELLGSDAGTHLVAQELVRIRWGDY